mmetsp:Transcript_19472/g.46133  ORF Transcript_19472/g.46133 Transcript_19472/m.46133 type:complete len:301 (-) Transcript_19472:139-1041(-)
MSSSSDCFSRSSASCTFASACRRCSSPFLYFALMLHSSSRSAATEPDLPRPRCTGAGMISPSPPLVGAMSSSSSSTRAARLRSKNGDTTSCPSPLHVGDTSSSSSSDVGRETAERVTSCPSSSRVGHTSSSSSLVAARLRRGTCGASSCPSPPLAGTRSSSSSSVRAARLRMRAVAAPSCPSPPRPGGTSSSSSSAGLRSANGCASDAAVASAFASSRSAVAASRRALAAAEAPPRRVRSPPSCFRAALSCSVLTTTVVSITFRLAIIILRAFARDIAAAPMSACCWGGVPLRGSGSFAF